MNKQKMGLTSDDVSDAGASPSISESERSSSRISMASSLDEPATQGKSRNKNSLVKSRQDVPHQKRKKDVDQDQLELPCKRMKRRRTKSERNSIAGVSPEKMEIAKNVSGDVELDAEIDKLLEEKAIKNNLTAWNVKGIIRQVLTNSTVKKMILSNEVKKKNKDGISSDDESNCFEPKLTRAKTKELINQNNLVWPIVSPSKSKKQSETHILINQELPDDTSEDEEYIPKGEKAAQSEEDCSGVSVQTDRGNLISNKKSSRQREGKKINDGFKAYNSKTTQSNENVIGFRTRSKLPLNDKPIEELESQLNPPDVTLDMYDWGVSDNEDYLDFLKGIMTESVSNCEANDDEEADPEYNIMEEELDDHDKEELRMDRAVKVTKKELNALVAELYDEFHLSSADDFEDLESSLVYHGPLQSKKENSNENENLIAQFTTTPAMAELPALNTLKGNISSDQSSSCKNAEDAKLVECRELPVPAQQTLKPQSEDNQGHKDENPNPTVENISCQSSAPVVQPQPPLFSHMDVVTIQHQARLHIQFLAQQYVLNSQETEPILRHIAATSKQLLLDLKHFSRIFNDKSLLSVCNLQSAVQLVNEWPIKSNLMSPIKKKILEQKFTESTTENPKPFPRNVVKLIAESNVFLYPKYLPHVYNQNMACPQKVYFLKSEDALLALGLEDLVDLRMQARTKASILKECLLPSRPSDAIYYRMKNLMKSKNSNALKNTQEYRIARSEAKEYMDMKFCSPINAEKHLLPEVWQDSIDRLKFSLEDTSTKMKGIKKPKMKTPKAKSQQVIVTHTIPTGTFIKEESLRTNPQSTVFEYHNEEGIPGAFLIIPKSALSNRSPNPEDPHESIKHKYQTSVIHNKQDSTSVKGEIMLSTVNSDHLNSSLKPRINMCSVNSDDAATFNRCGSIPIQAVAPHPNCVKTDQKKVKNTPQQENFVEEISSSELSEPKFPEVSVIASAELTPPSQLLESKLRVEACELQSFETEEINSDYNYSDGFPNDPESLDKADSNCIKKNKVHFKKRAIFATSEVLKSPDSQNEDLTNEPNQLPASHQMFNFWNEHQKSWDPSLILNFLQTPQTGAIVWGCEEKTVACVSSEKVIASPQILTENTLGNVACFDDSLKHMSFAHSNSSRINHAKDSYDRLIFSGISPTNEETSCVALIKPNDITKRQDLQISSDESLDFDIESVTGSELIKLRNNESEVSDNDSSDRDDSRPPVFIDEVSLKSSDEEDETSGYHTKEEELADSQEEGGSTEKKSSKAQSTQRAKSSENNKSTTNSCSLTYSGASTCSGKKNDEDDDNDEDKRRRRKQKEDKDKGVLFLDKEEGSEADRETSNIPENTAKKAKPSRSSKEAVSKRKATRTPKKKKRIWDKFNVASPESMAWDNDLQRDEEVQTAFVESFLTKVHSEVGPNLYNSFIQMLCECDVALDRSSQKNLQEHVKELLKDFPELVEEFCCLIYPPVPTEGYSYVELFRKSQEIQAEINFMKDLEKWTEKCPQYRAKVLNKIKVLKDNTNCTEKEIVNTMEPYFKGDAIMMDSFKSLFRSSYRPSACVESFETVQLAIPQSSKELPQEAISKEAEIVKLPEGSPIVATSSCPCSCHTEKSSRTYASRGKHCTNCSLKFQDGKVFQHSGRVIKPVSIEYTRPESIEKLEKNLCCFKCLPRVTPPSLQNKDSFKKTPSVSSISGTAVTTTITTTSVRYGHHSTICSPEKLSVIDSKQPECKKILQQATPKQDFTASDTVNKPTRIHWTAEDDKLILQTCQSGSINEAITKLLAIMKNKTKNEIIARLNYLVCMLKKSASRVSTASR